MNLATKSKTLTVAQYDRMIESGILTANDRVELLNGYLVEKMARNPPHDSAVSRVNKRVLRILPPDWVLRVQSALVLRNSEPEPDFAIVQTRPQAGKMPGYRQGQIYNRGQEIPLILNGKEIGLLAVSDLLPR